MRDFRLPRQLGAVAIAIGLGLLSVTCGKERHNTSVVARVGDATLTVEQVQNRVAPGLGEEETAAQRREFVDKWIEQQLVYQEALSQGLDENARVQQLLDEARQDGDQGRGDKGRADGALVFHDAGLLGNARHLAGVEVVREP